MDKERPACRWLQWLSAIDAILFVIGGALLAVDGGVLLSLGGPTYYLVAGLLLIATDRADAELEVLKVARWDPDRYHVVRNQGPSGICRLSYRSRRHLPLPVQLLPA